MQPTDRVLIFDTTLRDGEQSPGCSMNTAEKLLVAEALVDLGVDVLEAGFPVASPDDFEAVRTIAERFGDRTVVCALARCREGDLDRAGEAVAPAKRKRIHTFLGTSPVHRRYQLEMETDAVLELAVKSVERAKSLCDDVEFSPMDAFRTEPEFLHEIVKVAIEAGATTINVPDTVGYATPDEYAAMIRGLFEHVPNIGKAVVSTHCHDDLGLATANSLAGVDAGARQVECTINGLGERAGNAALEEVVMTLRTRADRYGLDTGIVSEKLGPTSRLVSSVTGMAVARNKAIVGRNAFAHESGIHQHGVLKNRETFEIIRGEDVGFVGTNLVLGKHSGRHAFRDRVAALGHDLDAETFERVFTDFIALADKKKEVYDSDIVALIETRAGEQAAADGFEVVSHHVSAGSGTVATMTLQLRGTDGDVRTVATTGGGPIHACFNALEEATGIVAKLLDFDVHSVSGGKDAQGEVVVRISVDDKEYRGKGVSHDVVESSLKAYLAALHRAASGRAT